MDRLVDDIECIFLMLGRLFMLVLSGKVINCLIFFEVMLLVLVSRVMVGLLRLGNILIGVCDSVYSL